MVLLRDRTARIERCHMEHVAAGLPIAPVIDAALPDAGLVLGALHDIMMPSEICMTPALGFCAGMLARTSGAVIWIEAEPDAYAPGLELYGLDPERLVFVPALGADDALWAMKESLRCHEVGGVLLVLEAGRLQHAAARRLQLTAEAGGTIGLLLRGAEPGRSVAQTRWRVTALPSREVRRPCWLVELQHSRRGRPQTWRMLWDDEAQQLLELPDGDLLAR